MSRRVARISHRQIANLKEALLLFVCFSHPVSSIILIPSVAPSMFGRDLAEQIRADAKGGDRQVPTIVEKCIDAVETLVGLLYWFVW